MSRFLFLFCLLAPIWGVRADELPKLGKSPLDEVIKAMTTDEKIRLLTGAGEVTEDLRAAVGYTDKIVPGAAGTTYPCLLYTSPSPRDGLLSRMPSSA